MSWDRPFPEPKEGPNERRLIAESVGHFPIPDQFAHYNLIAISSEYPDRVGLGSFT